MVNATNICEHMDVVASCGTRVGTVDKVEGSSIKLAKNDPKAGGLHHWVPMDWVSAVDKTVHLNKNSEEAMRDWKSESAASKA